MPEGPAMGNETEDIERHFLEENIYFKQHEYKYGYKLFWNFSRRTGRSNCSGISGDNEPIEVIVIDGLVVILVPCPT